MKTELPNVSKNEPQNFGSLSTCIYYCVVKLLDWHTCLLSLEKLKIQMC